MNAKLISFTRLIIDILAILGIFLSTQPIAKSSYQLNLAHFQPVNSTLAFARLQHSKNEKIREPEKNSQLSEMPCFQAFFGIYFCTFDINTTHSTWHERIRSTSNHLDRIRKHIASYFANLSV